MGSKHSRLSHSSQGDRRASVDSQKAVVDAISAEARAEFTVGDINRPENTRRAQSLYCNDRDRFCKYRNYFKNHHMSLAREVGRETRKSKMELLQWVQTVVGPLENGENFTKDEILEVAMVSAALSEYGESVLAKMYDRGELDALPNVPLHTHNLRMPGKQQACRNGSDALNKDKLEAAHYIGLEVMLRLNERLPVEHRMGEELRVILNHPSNLRLMLASSNQILHKKVDALLIRANGPISENKTQVGTKSSSREYARLVQIAKHAQDLAFQEAMIAANGHYLYQSLRNQFQRLEVSGRIKLWEIEKDKPELRQIPRSRYRSPSPVPRNLRLPGSPEKKPEPKPRMVHETTTLSPLLEKEHRNPFSRFAAKIFRSRHQKKNLAIPRSSATPAPKLHDRTVSIKRRGGKGANVAIVAKAKAKSHKANNGGKPHRNKDEKGKRVSRPVANETTTLSHDSNSDDHDSDYVDDVSDDGKTNERTLCIGPRGGKYYLNAAGKKVYVK
ncbi:hypothetical protein CCR75_002695 [Bremia lactucae]|uniref:Uncharacterized protein n=1 Tax=Bremia lactucae TaxID=4779 RepID=A0A976IGJ5_BRELC|nr:hypothetical protein CCR75_002695 [Bremia lactucae]